VSSQGPLSPSTQSSTSTAGQAGWTNNTSGLKSQEGTLSTTTPSLGGTSRTLRLSAYGFSVPSGATINGIVVEFYNISQSTEGHLGITLTKTVNVGTGTGKDVIPTASTGYQTLGTSSDLWGTTWTVAEINATGFGCLVDANDQDEAGGSMSLDHVRITVYYTATATSTGMMIAV
jgi:hypothetical protein